MNLIEIIDNAKQHIISRIITSVRNIYEEVVSAKLPKNTPKLDS